MLACDLVTLLAVSARHVVGAVHHVARRGRCSGSYPGLEPQTPRLELRDLVRPEDEVDAGAPLKAADAGDVIALLDELPDDAVIDGRRVHLQTALGRGADRDTNERERECGAEHG